MTSLRRERNLQRACGDLVLHLPLRAGWVQRGANITRLVRGQRRCPRPHSSARSPTAAPASPRQRPRPHGSAGSRLCLWESVLTSRAWTPPGRNKIQPDVFLWKKTTCYRPPRLRRSSGKVHDLFTMCSRASKLYKKHLLWITVLSRDRSVDNMKNVLSEYQRLKQSAPASSKTQRALLSYTEIKTEYWNGKLNWKKKKITPMLALVISCLLFLGLRKEVSRLFT